MYCPDAKNADKVTKQVVVPNSLRSQVMSLAHESLMGGHLGTKKTFDKVTTSFYWPGIHGDITQFCRSCDTCQKTVSKGKVTKAPLECVALIDVPLKRVAVDIIGKIYPRTKKQVRYLLGLTGYYRNYMPYYVTVAVPLTDLTKKGSPNVVVWGDPQEKAFRALKQCLINKPVLKLPDMTLPFVLRTDASDLGAGAVLMQQHGEELFPVAFASKKFSQRERAYSTMERECLALVWAVQKFQLYLYGRSFVLQTDHQPLIYLNRCKITNSRIMRWALFLQSYSIRIEAIKGSVNVGADYMSRLY